MPRPDVALGDRHDEAQVGLGQLLLGAVAVPDHVVEPPAQQRLERLAAGLQLGLGLGQALGRGHAGLDALGQGDLFVAPVSSATWPISLRYMRTGSELPPARHGRVEAGQGPARPEGRLAVVVAADPVTGDVDGAARRRRAGESAVEAPRAAAGRADVAARRADARPRRAPGPSTVAAADGVGRAGRSSTSSMPSRSSSSRTSVERLGRELVDVDHRVDVADQERPLGPAQGEQVTQPLAGIGRPRRERGHRRIHPLSSPWSRSQANNSVPARSRCSSGRS